MNNSTMFIRGQVWYWEDPLYGRKENNMDVTIGEATVRYNRYCIIVQNTDSITNSSVLVIPCSSINKSQNDIKIPLTHIFRKSYTYAKVGSIFPVHQKFLQRYVCTLPDVIMKQIEAKLIKLFLPSITNSFNNDDINMYFGIDMDNNNQYQFTDENNYDISIHVRSFINDQLIITNDNNVIKPRQLKEAFDQYCIINKLPVVEDIIEFIDSFTHVVNGSSYNFNNKFNYNNMEFKGIKIKDDLKLSINIDNNLINDDKSKSDKKSDKWNDEAIDKFLKFYINNGPEATSELFGIKLSTVSSYWYKWKYKLDIINDSTTDNIEKDNNIEKEMDLPVITNKDIDISDIALSISKVSNMIRDSLIKGKIVDIIDTKTIRSGNKIISNKTFYDEIGYIIYFTLLEFLDIKVTKRKRKCIRIPKVTSETEFLTTWYFFDKVYHDCRISKERDGVKMIRLYRRYYGKINKGIDKQWIENLKIKINIKFILSESDVNMICDYINKIYCDN